MFNNNLLDGDFLYRQEIMISVSASPALINGVLRYLEEVSSKLANHH